MKNITINNKERIIKLKINLCIYPKNIVIDVLKKIQQNCPYSFEEKKGYLFVKLAPKNDVDLNEFGYEFMDFLLSKIKEG